MTNRANQNWPDETGHELDAELTTLDAFHIVWDAQSYLLQTTRDIAKNYPAPVLQAVQILHGIENRLRFEARTR